ncbi:carboxylate-amine ligase [Ilumatobacter sp.]|uniref:carboxylate-amine ligase n=1 Tax=Ilumatobacter sp. TaxID=1967498 RepID=UPI003B51FBB0
MNIDFEPNARPTIGVEMELHLVDATTGDLASIAGEVLAEMGDGHPGGEHPKAKHELFQSTIEVITGVCDGPEDVRRDLQATLAELRPLLDRRDVAAMSSATHPFALASEQLISPDERYHRLIETMQWPARRLLICGMHIHVGVPDGEQAIAVINELTRHLPVFLALSASSPYFEGADSGMSSARSLVFESLPTAGLPPQISEWTEFEDFMDTLIGAGCIETVREVWWDIRPHPGFGTVELRMCDAMPTVHETVALAGLAQTLVVWCLDRIAEGTLPDPPTQWSVKQNRWLAARHGLDARLIVETEPGAPGPTPSDPHAAEVGGRLVDVVDARDLVGALVEVLRPTAHRIGTDAHLDDVLEIARTGSGTDRQRAVVADGGTLLDVVHHLVRELATDTPTAR